MYKAIEKENIEVIEYLIKNGEDINDNTRGLSNLEFALIKNKMKSAQFLIDNGASIEGKSGQKVLQYGVLPLRIDIVKFLIKNKINLNYQDENGDTILHTIAKGSIDINLENLQKHADESEHVKNSPNGHAKMQKSIDAIKSRWGNYPKVIELLLDNGIKIDLKNNDGKTAYMLAKENNVSIALTVLKNYNN